METIAKFRQLTYSPEDDSHAVTITVNGQARTVMSSMSVAAALLVSEPMAIRNNLADGSPRGPYCLMGVCFECLAEINDVPNVQSCMVKVTDGMQVNTANGR